jgi:hypothetical protein
VRNSVYIGFSCRKSWNPISWLIRICQGAPYSHVYVRFPSESLQRDLIYEASEFSVHFKNDIMLNKKSKIIKEYKLEVSDSAKIHALQFAIDNLGKPYGWLELFGFTWICLCKHLGFKVKNPLGDKSRAYICSELVVDILEELGYEFEEDSDSISPKDIDQFLQNKQIPYI